MRHHAYHVVYRRNPEDMRYEESVYLEDSPSETLAKVPDVLRPNPVHDMSLMCICLCISLRAVGGSMSTHTLRALGAVTTVAGSLFLKDRWVSNQCVIRPREHNMERISC